jgi:hypothetical protein
MVFGRHFVTQLPFSRNFVEFMLKSGGINVCFAISLHVDAILPE